MAKLITKGSGVYHLLYAYDYRDKAKEIGCTIKRDEKGSFVAWSCDARQAGILIKEIGEKLEYSEKCWNNLQVDIAKEEEEKKIEDELNDKIKEIKISTVFDEIENCELWNHQRQSYRYVSAMWGVKKGCLLYAETRTGKTRTTLYLLRNYCKGGAIVFCPRNVIPVWLHEAWKIGMEGLVTFGDGSWSERAERIEGDLREGKHCIYIINYAAALNDDIAAVARKMSAIVADESQKIKMLGAKPKKHSNRFRKFRLGSL